MKLLITGANGFLGYRLASDLGRQHEVYAANHTDLDITDIDRAYQIFQEWNPDVLIHCAGVSNKMICAADPDTAHKVIVSGTGNLAKVCKEFQTKMIFCSSDQVYEGGTSLEKHQETEQLNPASVYARCKYQAETSALSIWEETVCLRLTAMYDIHFDTNREHPNLLAYITRDLKEKNKMFYTEKEYRGFTDVTDVVKNLPKTFELPGGIYNFGSENDSNTFQLLKRVMETVYQDSALINMREGEFIHLSMDTSKIKSHGIEFSDSYTGLVDALTRIKMLRDGR